MQSWLKGKIRDEIAQEFGKSQGTISNIISRMIMIGVIMMLILRRN
jgi:DNA-binding CsgD family transcriptional regulator